MISLPGAFAGTDVLGILSKGTGVVSGGAYARVTTRWCLLQAPVAGGCPILTPVSGGRWAKAGGIAC